MRIYLFLFMLLFSGIIFSQDESIDTLLLDQYYFVEGPHNSQPSGLAICADTLYTVSDKHDGTIFRIEIKGDQAFMKPAVEFVLPDPQRRGWFDFEGITCDELGNFYLISETRFQILRVNPRTGQFAWIGPNLKPAGRAAGLFQVRNAYSEGLTYTGNQQFWVAAERRPRGILTVDLAARPARIDAYLLDESRFQFSPGVSPDFAGLYFFKDKIYGLVRNAYIVCELVIENNRPREGKAFSFRELAETAQFRYKDMRYGHAEGLAMDERFIYIILDNNSDAREADPHDQRPMLFRFLNPLTQSQPAGSAR